MTGPEHFRRAEGLIAKSQTVDMSDGYAQLVIAQAQAHATLALAAATAEGVRDASGQPLVQPPIPANPVDPEYPGSEWGRAIYGGGQP